LRLKEFGLPFDSMHSLGKTQLGDDAWAVVSEDMQMCDVTG
jgi:hypothetical protein